MAEINKIIPSVSRIYLSLYELPREPPDVPPEYGDEVPDEAELFAPTPISTALNPCAAPLLSPILGYCCLNSLVIFITDIDEKSELFSIRYCCNEKGIVKSISVSTVNCGEADTPNDDCIEGNIYFVSNIFEPEYLIPSTECVVQLFPVTS